MLLILVSSMVLAGLFFKGQLPFTMALVSVLLIFQVFELIYFSGKTNRELKKFLEAVRFHDFSTRFELNQLGGSFRELENEFKHVFETLRGSEAAKESQEELLTLILQNITLGIIVVDEHGTIFMMNEKARETLQIPEFKSWGRLVEKRPQLGAVADDFSFTGRKILQLNNGGQEQELFVDLEHITLSGKVYHLLTLSDLRSEIEQKEIDAWHKLIRILAHEVMNSVTPVVSLSETISHMLKDEQGKLVNPQDLQGEDLEDINEALQTIKRRSKGMLSFVEDYRKLTKLPAPNYEVFSVKELFADVVQLWKNQALNQGVNLEYELSQSRLALKADRKMVEQLLINLIKNALGAMEEQTEGKIILRAKLKDDMLVIRVSDNGPGIHEEVLPNIFIPFYSTRKNGTGIGLTLSKNIMKLHGGNITVESTAGEGTSFVLSFRG